MNQTAFLFDTSAPGEGGTDPGPEWCEQALEKAARTSAQVDRVNGLEPQQRQALLQAVGVYAALRHSAYLAARKHREGAGDLSNWMVKKPELAKAVACLSANMIEPTAIGWWAPAETQLP